MLAVSVFADNGAPTKIYLPRSTTDRSRLLAEEASASALVATLPVPCSERVFKLWQHFSPLSLRRVHIEDVVALYQAAFFLQDDYCAEVLAAEIARALAVRYSYHASDGTRPQIPSNRAHVDRYVADLGGQAWHGIVRHLGMRELARLPPALRAAAAAEVGSAATLALCGSQLSEHAWATLTKILPSRAACLTCLSFERTTFTPPMQATLGCLTVLTGLRSLTMRACGLNGKGAHYLQAVLDKLPRLETLSLPNNAISATGVRAVVSGLQPCRGLQTLDISGNVIGPCYLQIALDIARLSKLQSLSIFNCVLEECASAGSLKQLSKLNCLTHIRVGNEAYGGSYSMFAGAALCAAISSLPFLRHVHIEHMRLRALRFLTALTSLSALVLHRCVLSFRKFTLLLPHLPAKALRILDVRHAQDFVTPPTRPLLTASALAPLTALTHVHLDTCVLDPRHFPGTVSGTTQMLPGLNGIGSLAAPQPAVACGGVTPLRGLVELVLTRCPLGPLGGAALAACLSDWRGLRRLALQFCEPVGADVGVALCAALRTKSSLRALEVEALMDDEDATPKHWARIGVCLAALTQLEVLMWRGDGLDGDSMDALAPWLGGCTGLKVLDFGRNPLESHGVASLALGLAPGAVGLRRLCLSSCQIRGGKGVQALVDVLQRMRALEELGMQNNSLGLEGFSAVAGALRGSTQLTRLRAGRNGIGPDGKWAALALLTCIPELKDLEYV